MDTEREIVDHMEINRTQPDVIFPLPYRKGSPMIAVEKQGGGYPERPHVGRWICQLIHAGELIHSTADMETGTPHTHYEVAGIYAETLVYGENTHKELSDAQHEALDGALEEFWCNVEGVAKLNGREL